MHIVGVGNIRFNSKYFFPNDIRNLIVLSAPFVSTLTPWRTLFIKHAYVLSHFSCVQLIGTLWTVAHQALLSMGFSRQEYWSGLLCPPPEDLHNPGIEPESSSSPTLAGGSLKVGITGEENWLLGKNWNLRPSHKHGRKMVKGVVN